MSKWHKSEIKFHSSKKALDRYWILQRIYFKEWILDFFCWRWKKKWRFTDTYDREKRQLEHCWCSTGVKLEQTWIRSVANVYFVMVTAKKYQYFSVLISWWIAVWCPCFWWHLPSWLEQAWRIPCKGFQKNLFSLWQTKPLEFVYIWMVPLLHIPGRFL